MDENWVSSQNQFLSAAPRVLQQYDYPQWGAKWDVTDYPEFSFHMIVNLICWGLLADVGIVVARYGKVLSNRLEIHAVFMWTLVLPSVIAEAFMLAGAQNPPETQQNEIRSIHDTLGIIFLAIICAEALFGVFVRFMMKSATIFNYLKYIQLFHGISGHCIYIIGKIQLGLGLYLIFSKVSTMVIIFWIVYVVSFLWRVILEMLYNNGMLLPWFKLTQEDRIKSETKDSLANYVDTNNQHEISQDKIWCIFNNSVVDLTGLSHPGGDFIWRAVIGREVSRFIYGAYGLEQSTIKAYKHSQYAFQMIEDHTIGGLNDIPFYYLGGLEESQIQSSRNYWILNKITPITSTIGYFEFCSDRIKTRTYLASEKCFGRHFIVSSVKNKSLAPRPYTMILAASPIQVNFREQLELYVSAELKGNGKPSIQVDQVTDKFPLMIKRYDVGGLSQYLHSHPNEEYLIEGPYGTSFGLPEEGKFVIICGGTGLFPFLDLLDYFYKMTIYELLNQKVSQNSANYSNQTQQKFNNSLHLTLILAIAGPEDLICKDIYLNMLKYQSQLKKPLFAMHIKSKKKSIEGVNTTQERFDKQFFKNNLVPLLEYRRFLICGPPAMNREIPNELKAIGIPDDYIHLV